MRRVLGVAIILFVWTGCGPEFEMRKEPDMQRIDPKRASKLRNIHVRPGDVARVTDRSSWQIHTSLSNRAALIDGDPATAASSTDDHRKGEWILIDLGSVCHFQHVRQLHSEEGGEPPGFRVDTADAHGFPFTLQYIGTGQPGASEATFTRAVDARFIRITLVDDSSKPWIVTELDVD